MLQLSDCSWTLNIHSTSKCRPRRVPELFGPLILALLRNQQLMPAVVVSEDMARTCNPILRPTWTRTCTMYGFLYQLGVHVVGVLVRKALLLWVYIVGPLIFWKLQYLIEDIVLALILALHLYLKCCYVVAAVSFRVGHVPDRLPTTFIVNSREVG